MDFLSPSFVILPIKSVLSFYVTESLFFFLRVVPYQNNSLFTIQSCRPCPPDFSFHHLLLRSQYSSRSRVSRISRYQTLNLESNFLVLSATSRTSSLSSTKVNKKNFLVYTTIYILFGVYHIVNLRDDPCLLCEYNRSNSY